MFSSLNNFLTLPSVLQKSPSPGPPPRQMDSDDEADDEAQTKAKEEGDVREEEERKESKVTENFIFVRPPPAKSNHPLNLQVQLLPPNTRAPGGLSTGPTPRQSIDGDAVSVQEDGAPLSRTSSNRSDYSSTSTSSFASFSSTASGRRVIVPLYNLQAHNVMTNTIVDAGTDAKIAKFVRRGLEMVDLAGMEVVEVWAASTSADAIMLQNPRASSVSSRPTSRPTTPTPTSSALSLSSAGSQQPAPPLDHPVPKKKENLFGRMFKKKPDNSVVAVPIPEIPPTIASEPPTPGVEQRTPTTPTPASSRHSRHLSATSPYMPRNLSPSPNPSKRMSLSMERPAVDVPQLVLLPPTLGIQPQLNVSVPSPTPDASLYASLVQLFTTNAYPPTFSVGGNPFVGRGPAMYVWTVRHWMKGGESVLAGMLSGGRHSAGPGDGVEVRVEWRRGKAGKDSKRRRERREKSTVEGTTVSRRTSVSSKRSTSRVRQPTVDLGGDDDGEESDPEDSETPWACTIKVKRMSPARTSPGATPMPRPATLPSTKVKVGTLSPTPHHPKVVAMLKVPYPLPDIEVDRVRVVKRRFVTIPPDEEAGEVAERRVMVSDAPDGKLNGLVLSGEEIKDVVCSTGLWLVVREGFGGVGKVSRKGDGWRIRA